MRSPASVKDNQDQRRGISSGVTADMFMWLNAFWRSMNVILKARFS